MDIDAFVSMNMEYGNRPHGGVGFAHDIIFYQCVQNHIDSRSVIGHPEVLYCCSIPLESTEKA